MPKTRSRELTMNERELALSAGDYKILYSFVQTALTANSGANYCAGVPTSACKADDWSCCLLAKTKNNIGAAIDTAMASDANAAALARILQQPLAELRQAYSDAKQTIANSAIVQPVLPYSATPSTSARAFVSGTNGSLTDGGSVAGLVIGALFVVGALCCFWCLCTRKIIWKSKPGASADTDNLEIVCAARDAPAAEAAGTTFRVPSAYSPSQPDFGRSAVGGGGEPSAAPAAASSPLRMPSPSGAAAGGASSAAADTQAAFLDAVARGNTAQVVAALKAAPQLAAAVDAASSHSAIHKAVKANNVTILKAIADADPASLNRVDKNGASPLHHAVVYQNLDAITFLVSAGADMGVKDKNGETQLDLARKLFKKGVHKTDAVVTALEALNRK